MRHAGTGKVSGKKFNSPGLCFKSSNDATNYARHLVEEPNKWLASNDLDILKAYLEAKYSIVCGICVGSCPTKYKLVFSSIPDRRQRKISKSAYLAGMNSGDIKCHGGKALMFTDFAYFINGPQGVIPSLVRLERFKERDNWLGKTWARVIYSAGKITSVSAKRKVNLVEVFSPNLYGDGINGMIKGCPKILNRIRRNVSKQSGKGLPSSLEFMNLVNSISVWLDDMTVWLTCDKGIKPSVQITDVSFCTRNPTP